MDARNSPLDGWPHYETSWPQEPKQGSVPLEDKYCARPDTDIVTIVLTAAGATLVPKIEPYHTMGGGGTSEFGNLLPGLVMWLNMKCGRRPAQDQTRAEG